MRLTVTDCVARSGTKMLFNKMEKKWASVNTELESSIGNKDLSSHYRNCFYTKLLVYFVINIGHGKFLLVSIPYLWIQLVRLSNAHMSDAKLSARNMEPGSNTWARINGRKTQLVEKEKSSKLTFCWMLSAQNVCEALIFL